MKLRFHEPFDDDDDAEWTVVTFCGTYAEAAQNILATGLLRRDDTVELWDEDDEDWREVE